MNKMSEFYMIFARKILFPEFCGIIPDSKAESERNRPQHQQRDHSGRATGALVLNKLFVRLLVLVIHTVY